MGEQKNGPPVTKELFKIEPPRREIPKPNHPMRQTPPPIPASRAAHAGREKLDETPAILDPKVAVEIARTLTDSAEIRIDTVNTDPLMMETSEFRDFMRKAEYIDNRKNIDPSQFANSIMFSQPKSETERGARYIAIRRDDGNTWRLYPHMESLASIEKFEKCMFRATIRVDGKDYQLYWETPELKQK